MGNLIVAGFHETLLQIRIILPETPVPALVCGAASSCVSMRQQRVKVELANILVHVSLYN